MSFICEKDVSRIPQKYKRASEKKIARKLRKMPVPMLEKKNWLLKLQGGRL